MIEQEILIKDDDMVVLSPRKAFVKGHLVITPLHPYKILEEVPPQLVLKMFQVANKLSSVLFDALQCHGTNILIQNGVAAGQINPQVSLSIIPRYEDDGLGLEWTPKPTEQDKLELSFNRFMDVDAGEKAAKYLEEQKSKAEEKKETQVMKADPKKKNYLLSSLDKVA